MRTTGKSLFPLLVLLVENQMKAQLIELNHLIILDLPDKPAAGFYKHDTKTMCVNVGVLDNYLGKYEIAKDDTFGLLKCAVAITFEECYHAIHPDEMSEEVEEKAKAYAIQMVSRVPEDLLISHGGELYEKTKASPLALPVQPEIEVKTFPLASGGMFEFVNKLEEMQMPDITVDTRYGNMSLKKEEEGLSTFTFSVNMEKLNDLKETLGNIGKVGLEHGGLIYSWEDEKTGWEVFVDIDEKQMLEINTEKPLTVTMLRSGEDRVIEATS